MINNLFHKILLFFHLRHDWVYSDKNYLSSTPISPTPLICAKCQKQTFWQSGMKFRIQKDA